jgi:3D (Asp-Asp-Asp) domain-containing protein
VGRKVPSLSILPCLRSRCHGPSALAGTYLELVGLSMPGIIPPPHPDELSSLHHEVARLSALAHRRGRIIQALGVTVAALLVFGIFTGRGLSEAQRMLSACRISLDPSTRTLTALASLREEAPSNVCPPPDTGGWSGQFTVTMYTAYDPSYGKTNDGWTSTMKRADPGHRIVAVDPRLIPYHSQVWIEGLGWHTAEDCGGAIKGYRLDVMAHSRREAFAWGRRARRVVVVPPSDVVASSQAPQGPPQV